MDELEFDRTRKAINVQKLSEEERKKILEAFKQKGGKVLNEKSLKKESDKKKMSTSYSEEKTPRKDMKSDRKLPSQLMKEEKLKEVEQIAKEKITKEKELKQASSFMNLFMLRLSAWFDKIIFFNTRNIHPGFLSVLNLEFKRSIMECNIVCTEFLSDKKRLDMFKNNFNNPFYLELIKRVYLLYERNMLSEFSRNEEVVNIENLRNPGLFFLRKLYILAPFRELTLKILLSCIDIEEKIYQKGAEIYKNKRKRITEAWRTIMEEIYPKLIKLVQLIENKKLEPYTLLFEEMIGLEASEKLNPNFYKTFDDVNLSSLNLSVNEIKNSNLNKPKNVEEKPDEKKEAIDPEEEKKQQIHNKIVSYGIRFLSYFTIDELRKKFDPKDEFRDVPIYDKIFIIYLFLNFFDSEFGFLLSTNKLKLNIVIKDGVKINYKDEMLRLYESFRKIYDAFRKYYFDHRELKKFLEDDYLNKNSLDYSKKLDYFQDKKMRSARETFKLMVEYVTQLENILLILYKDVKNIKKIIINPEEIIKFEAEAQNKLMNNKKIMDIIRDAYATIYSLSDKIRNGELRISNSIDFTEEEFNLYFKI